MISTLYLSLICVSLISGYPHPLEECDCLNGGECIVMPNGEKGCSCTFGFGGKHCEVFQGRFSLFKNKIDEEKEYKVQCLNNGTVYYDVNGKLKCKCKPFATGAKCEFVLPTTSECAPNPCFNGGFCAELSPGYRCTCPPAYTGLNCEKTISELQTINACVKPCDPCAQNPCSSNGQCVNASCNAFCICNPLFTGTFCDTPVTMEPITTTTPCPSIVTTTTPCSIPTTTAISPCLYSCDPCAQNPCSQNGVCHNFSCTAYCECNVGYTGQFCDVSISLPDAMTTTPYIPQCNACPAQNACSNNGECFTLSCEAYCVCNVGFTGEICDVPLQDPVISTSTPCPPTCDPCAQNPCSSNGQCTNFNCTAYCVCNAGYTGQFCDILLQTTAITTTSTPCPAPAPAAAVSTVALPTSTYLASRCNFSIGLFNDGAFTTRFKVEYKIDGITQPLLTSRRLSIIGQSTFNTIPYYATDIIVTVEVLGWNWFTVKVDSGITTATYCTKCYKLWGTVTGVNIDYMKC